MKPRLQRDLLIEFGEAVVQRKKFIDLTTFKFLFLSKTIREAAMNRLSRLTILHMDGGQARFSERGVREDSNLYINFRGNPAAHRLFKMFIDAMLAESKENVFLTEVHINALTREMDVVKLMEALSPLRGLKLLSFPYELHFFKSSKSKILKQLIANNQETLNVLKHLNDASWVPEQMRDNISMVNSSTLRNGTLQDTQDFLAFYGRGASSVHVKAEDEDGVTMSMCIHRHAPIIRRRKWYHPLCTHLKLRVVDSFNPISGIRFLNSLACLGQDLPQLKQLDLQMVVMDMDPTMEDDGFGDTQESLVPSSSKVVNELAHLSIDWMKKALLPFRLHLTTILTVDFERSGDVEKDLLDAAAEETNRHFQEFKMEITPKNGSVEMHSRQRIGEAGDRYEVRCEFRIVSFSEKPLDVFEMDDLIFRSDYCFL